MDAQTLAADIGPLVGAARRGAVGDFARGRTKELALRYDDVRDWDAMSKILDREGVAFGDGQEWITIWIERDT